MFKEHALDAHSTVAVSTEILNHLIRMSAAALSEHTVANIFTSLAIKAIN